MDDYKMGMGDNTKDIYFIGGVWDQQTEHIIYDNSIGSIQNAANLLQWKFIKGLDRYTQNGVNIISAVFIGAFPKRYKRLMIKRSVFNHTNDINHKDVQVGFLNLPLIKHISRYFSIKNELVRSLKGGSVLSQSVVLGYSMTFSTVETLKYIKKRFPRIKTCLIVPDLPEYMNLDVNPKNNIFSKIKKYITEKLYKDIKDIDSFVLLTEQMYCALEINKPYCVVEGIIPDYEYTPSTQKLNKTILYSGTLAAKYGVKDLVKAFEELDPQDYSLTICGYGDTEKYIRDKANKNNKIIFLGTVPNDQVLELQRNSYLLVNPRKNDSEYTKYSFPSKILEYMASGRPVLTYKLSGFPDEYDNYLLYIDDIYSSLKKTLEMEPETLEKIGKEAYDFVLNNKNKYAQTKKIAEMIEKL